MLDPTVGVWMTEDPIGFEAGDPNLRRYVGNNATNGVDRSGLQERSDRLREREKVAEPAPQPIPNFEQLERMLVDLAPDEVGKAEARRVAIALKETFYQNRRTDFTIGRSEKAKGYYCYEWVYGYENAAKSVLEGRNITKYFEFRRQGARHVGDREKIEKSGQDGSVRIHAWLAIIVRGSGKTVYVDDGFANGNYVHTEQPVPSGYAFDLAALASLPEQRNCNVPLVKTMSVAEYKNAQRLREIEEAQKLKEAYQRNPAPTWPPKELSGDYTLGKDGKVYWRGIKHVGLGGR